MYLLTPNHEVNCKVCRTLGITYPIHFVQPYDISLCVLFNTLSAVALISRTTCCERQVSFTVSLLTLTHRHYIHSSSTLIFLIEAFRFTSHFCHFIILLNDDQSTLEAAKIDILWVSIAFLRALAGSTN